MKHLNFPIKPKTLSTLKINATANNKILRDYINEVLDKVEIIEPKNIKTFIAWIGGNEKAMELMGVNYRTVIKYGLDNHIPKHRVLQLEDKLTQKQRKILANILQE